MCLDIKHVQAEIPEHSFRNLGTAYGPKSHPYPFHCQTVEPESLGMYYAPKRGCLRT